MNIQIALFSIQLDLKALNNADYPSASWKQMFFTQPALCTMQMRNILLCRHDFVIFPIRKLKADGGVKMSQLIRTGWHNHSVASNDHSIISGLERYGADPGGHFFGLGASVEVALDR